MKIIIIEDEDFAAEDLAKNLQKIGSDIEIMAMLRSVKEAVSYLSEHPQPDLFFSDIQLGDGLSFDIFRAIKTKVPVVFITAYDAYALQAFKANGIDYILKPFDHHTLSEAVNKFKSFYKTAPEENKIEKLLDYINSHPKTTSILVYQKDKIIPLKINDIALFFTENLTVKVLCFDGKQYVTSSTLEELEKTVGKEFFRANRQYILNRHCIKDVTQHFSRKLYVNFKIDRAEKVIVSKEKSQVFLDWLSKY